MTTHTLVRRYAEFCTPSHCSRPLRAGVFAALALEFEPTQRTPAAPPNGSRREAYQLGWHIGKQAVHELRFAAHRHAARGPASNRKFREIAERDRSLVNQFGALLSALERLA